MFGQADDDLSAVAHDFSFASVDLFGQILTDALELGVSVHLAAAPARTARFPGTTSAVGRTRTHISNFHRRLYFGLNVGDFGKKLDFTLGHGAGLLRPFGRGTPLLVRRQQMPHPLQNRKLKPRRFGPQMQRCRLGCCQTILRHLFADLMDPHLRPMKG